jgi:DNA gyrase subunit B
LVEGESAGGSAKQGRDRKNQAVLPLRGKILNVEKARFDKMLSFEEIRILITALGTGIGPGDFDIEKLRYHKIVIMTDADVDGSHIRTLLLTFFYRQMPEVIQRGYLYIAQPPLYKLKKGKMERYVKDETEFASIIVQAGSDNLIVRDKDGKEVKAEQHQDVLVELGAVSELLSQYELELVDPRVVFALAEKFSELGLENWSDSNLQAKAPEVQKVLQAAIPGMVTVAASSNDTDSGAVLTVTTRRRAIASTTAISKRFVSSERFKRLRSALEAAIQTFGPGPYRIISDDASGRDLADAAGIQALSELIDARGRKGLAITRYKGLGEMNPEQLWETTMDPKFRTLLQVNVEDAIDADQIFTVLMGDEVEPRRRFIEENALQIRNLDI